MPLDSGATLGRFRIRRRLGAGGMGEVYLADDLRLGRQVALKLLLGRGGALKDLERLEREARAASALNHPGILTVYDIGEAGGVHFIATEFVDGETLRERMARGPMPVADAVGVARAVARALGAAHAAGVVHRDIKPENIMIRADGLIKVLDFGIATAGDLGRTPDDALQATMPASATMAGTLQYMSPEQARGQPIDPRSDIFSLGIVLYEMLAGRPPFGGPGPAAVLLALLNDPIPPLAQFRTDVPPALHAILERTLARDPARRYRDMNTLAGDLEGLRRLSGGDLPGGERQPGTPAADLAAAARTGNLPVPPTRLVGREAELRAICRLIADEGSRLVVITGPGGSGKTRLAIEAGFSLASTFDDGVCFVPLAAVRAPGLVGPAIAQALELKEAADDEPAAVVARHLRNRRMLLLLDNFEQIVDAASLIAELLAGCPLVGFLVTSRAGLRVRGEQEFPLAPLALPDPARLPPAEGLAGYPAVALFVERARAARPDFALTPDNAAAVAEICVRLDGLPLALELAAARVKLLPPQAMLPRLARRLPLLTGGARDLPARQQTLRDAVAWSYNLLEPAEQALFARLAVFSGGFDLEAAEAVSGGDVEILDTLESLVSQSLLRRLETSGGAPRFSMLETVREFASDRLDEHDDAAMVRERHAGVFLTLAEAAERGLAGDRRVEWLDRLEGEHDNLRAALDWSLSGGDAARALRFGVALWRFWETRGLLREGRSRMEQILALPEAAGQASLWPKALYAAGVLADAPGDYVAARRWFGQALTLHRQAGDAWGIANSLNNLGIVAVRQRDFDVARALYQESLALWRRLGNRHAVALSLVNLGNIAAQQQGVEQAASLYEESLATFREMGDRRGVGLTLARLAGVRQDQGDEPAARELYGEAAGLLREAGDAAGFAACLTDLGHLMRDGGDAGRARMLYQEALATFGELGDARGVARVIEAFGQLAAREGIVDRAFRLAGAAAALRDRAGAPLAVEERAALDAALEAARASAGVPDAEGWRLQGYRLPVEQAIEQALALQGPAS
jgi:predicted ATPase